MDTTGGKNLRVGGLRPRQGQLHHRHFSFDDVLFGARGGGHADSPSIAFPFVFHKDFVVQSSLAAAAFVFLAVELVLVFNEVSAML